MSVDYSVYVGPYLVVPSDFVWWKWESVVADGRGMAGVDEDSLILVPNTNLDGVQRQLRFDCYEEGAAVHINPAMLVRESAKFEKLTAELRAHLEEEGIEYHEGWGVVPCWS